MSSVASDVALNLALLLITSYRQCDASCLRVFACCGKLPAVAERQGAYKISGPRMIVDEVETVLACEFHKIQFLTSTER